MLIRSTRLIRSPEHCPRCGPTVTLSQGKLSRHQVSDLRDKATVIVTEYQRQHGQCQRCRHLWHGSLPAGVPPGQLGPQALALIATLAGTYHLTQDKIRRLLSDVIGITFSLGAISQAQGKIAQAILSPVTAMPISLSLHDQHPGSLVSSTSWAFTCSIGQPV